MKKCILVVIALLCSLFSISMAFANINLYGSFTSAGTWQWDGSTWAQLTPYNPQLMVTSGSNLYGSFAEYGIWQWDGSTWTQLTPYDPQSMVASGSNLYGSFAEYGLWLWDGTTWTSVTPNNPESMVILGSDLYGAFAGGGIWQWNGSSWIQVTPNSADLMAATCTALYGSFAGGGIWEWDRTTWSQITPNNPQLLVASGDNLYGSFAGWGIWKWDGTNWTQATPNNPQLMVASKTVLYGSFAGGGIWQWDSSTWSQISLNNPASMVVPPVAGSCAAGALPLGSAAVFGVLGGTALTIANPTSVTGNVGSPAITPAAGPSTLVGTMYDSSSASDLTVIANAVQDMQTAVGCAVVRPCDFNYAAATDFGGMMLAPGIHCVSGEMSIGSNLTLSTPGVYIFRATGALTSVANVVVNFGGTANACNSSVFWVSSGAGSNVSIGAGNTFLGTIMVGNLGDPGAATLGANTTLLNGRVLSTNAVTLGGNQITIPIP